MSDFTSVYDQADVQFSGHPTGYAAITFGDMTSYEIVPVPEPSSTALLGTVGLLGLAGYRERRRLKGMAQRKNK